MSMNLQCSLIELWQTPSEITYMCLVQADGSIPPEVKGKEARRALHCYLEWVKGSLNGVWNCNEDLERQHDLVSSHTEWINKIINNKNLRVYMQ